MLELKRKTLNIKIDDSEHCLKFPSVKMLGEFRDKWQKDEKNEFEMLINFLDELGLKKEVSETLEVEHLDEIFNIVSSQKKI